MSYTPKQVDSIPTPTTLGVIKIGEGLMVDQYNVLHVNYGYGLGVDGSGVLNFTPLNTTQGGSTGVVSGVGTGAGVSLGSVPVGNGTAPVLDELANHVIGHYQFNEPYGESSFIDASGKNLLQISSVDAYTLGTGGVFDNSGLLRLGARNTTGQLKLDYIPSTNINNIIHNTLDPTGNFCVEGWFYPTSIPNTSVIFATSTYPTKDLTGGPDLNNYIYNFEYSLMSLSFSSDGKLTFKLSKRQPNLDFSFYQKAINPVFPNTKYTYEYNEGVEYFSISSATGIISPNNWYHIALSRGMDRFTVYVNGVNVLETPDTSDGHTKYVISEGAAGAYAVDYSKPGTYTCLAVGGEYYGGLAAVPTFNREITWGNISTVVPTGSFVYSGKTGYGMYACDYESWNNLVHPNTADTTTVKQAYLQACGAGLDAPKVGELIISFKSSAEYSYGIVEGTSYQLKFFPPVVGTGYDGYASTNGFCPDLSAKSGTWTAFKVVRDNIGIVTSAYFNNFNPAGGSISSDAYWSNVSAVLTLNNNSYDSCGNSVTATDIVFPIPDMGLRDRSTNALTVTTHGSPSISTFTPYGNADLGSINLGAADYITVPTTSSLIFAGDFTVEGWVYPSGGSTASRAFYSTAADLADWKNLGAGAIFVCIDGSFSICNGSAQIDATGTPRGAVNAWSHIALVRQGTSIKSYVNGVLAYSATYSGSIGNTGSSTGFGIFDKNQGGRWYLQGYIAGARIVSGTALYTAAFTPSTTPYTAITGTQLLLTVSTVNSGYNNGLSAFFNGTTSSLAVPQVQSFDASDFTIEAWINVKTLTNGYQPIISTRTGAFDGLNIYLDTNNTLSFAASTDGSSWNSTALSSFVPTVNTWVHVAAVRSSNSISLFANGNLIGSGSIIGPIASTTSTISIGYSSAYPSGQQHFSGYMANVRVTKGIARYTTSFTPPTDYSIGTTPSTNINIKTTPEAYTPHSTVYINTYYVVNIAKNLRRNITSMVMSNPVPTANYSPVPYFQQYATSVTVARTIILDGEFPADEPILTNLPHPTVVDYTPTWFNIRGAINQATQTLLVPCRYTNSHGAYVNPESVIMGLFTGTYSKPRYPFIGYLDELRVTKDIPRYIENFTPPTANFKEV